MASRPILFGHIEGIEINHHFTGRQEMMPSSFHRQWGQGIDGNGKDGAACIILSGGYADDEDHGDEIIYTGAGGNKDGKQIEDQSWEHRGNAALITSMNKGLPVRVSRGAQHKSEYSPDTGYSYAGLFSVIEAWEENGIHGFKVCRFKLIAIDAVTYTDKPGSEPNTHDYSVRERKFSTSTVNRVIRDSEISRQVKDIYDYHCQVCNTAIKVKHGLYAEGAHIHPLGRPHNGDDCLANILCLCPNHHIMFDRGTFSINDDFTLTGEEKGELNLKHHIDVEYLSYHRRIHGYE